MPLGREVGLSSGNIVLDGDPVPPPKKDTVPNFRPMSIVAKRTPISATAELLFSCGLVWKNKVASGYLSTFGHTCCICFGIHCNDCSQCTGLQVQRKKLCLRHLLLKQMATAIQATVPKVHELLYFFLYIFTARRSYATAVLGVVILSVRLSVTRALCD